jgi:predicted O-methyltransferase YrrM
VAISALRRALKAVYYWPPFLPLRACRMSLRYFNSYYRDRVFGIVGTSFRRPHEVSNFTYALTERCLLELAHTVAVAAARPVEEILAYMREVEDNAALIATLRQGLRQRGYVSDDMPNPFGRRIGWYAFARALKPRVIVETGVDRGYGALLLCAALLANKSQGAPGRYFGTDLNPEAGWILSGDFATMGKILYGDSIQSLQALPETIDLFINDSDHSADYEDREYQIITPKLSSHAVILGDNSHVTDKLARYSRKLGRSYLFFKEEPRDHWYPGAGIGISFPKGGAQL